MSPINPMSRKPLVLGIDGGGTKTIGLVGDMSANILARREVGATNPNVVGFDSAAQNIHKLILQCSADVGCSPAELRSVVLALAGAGQESTRKRLKEAVGGLFASDKTAAGSSKSLPIGVETDARAALEGAFDGGPGVVIIAGTGSIVIGKTQHGDILTVGGWGRTLGDEGSGYHIGREALRAVTLQYDRRGDATKLRDIFGERFQWKSREDIITAVYQEKFDLSKLAPVVMEVAADNDIVAQKLLQHAALQLAEQARGIVMQMGILRKVGLVMSGGLIDHETVYSNTLHMKLMKLFPQVDIRPALHPPAHGAVLLAIERVKRD
jgi:glucosamine kinase